MSGPVIGWCIGAIIACAATLLVAFTFNTSLVETFCVGLLCGLIGGPTGLWIGYQWDGRPRR